MGHNSGSAKRRRRRIRALMAEKDFAEMRLYRGGDIIDLGFTALRAVHGLLCGQRGDLHLVDGDDLAGLMGLIVEEIGTGREVQQGTLDFDAG